MQGLRDIQVRRLIVDVQLEADVGQAGLRQDLFGLLRVKTVWALFQCAQITFRQKRLMGLELALQQIVSNAFIVEQPTRGFPERRIAQRR
ncbi:hypothetical protein D3C78_1387260 [compost metagenome]